MLPMKQIGKTVRQIADEIGVTKQAVFKKIKSEPLSTSLQRFISKVDGTVYISVDGENLVKQAFIKNDPSTKTDNQPSTVDSNQTSTVDSKFIEHLLSEIEYLRAENIKLTEALRAEQTLHAETKGMLQTKQQLVTEDNAAGEDKPTFKARLKYLFKGEH